MALSTADLETIRRFSRMAEYRAWLAVLEKRLAEADAKLRVCTGEELVRQQGRAQALAEILDEADQADRSLNQQVRTRPMKTAGIRPV